MKKAVRLYISGTVQTLFYKGYIKENAEKLDVKGFIRSLEDGRIEAFFEGNQDEVEKLIQTCKTHKHSKIENVDIKEERFQGLKDFKILHI